MLKKTAVRDLKHFQWNALLKEWMKEAPTFYKVLKSIAMPPTISGNQRKKQLLKPIVGCAGAVLLKGRNSRLSAVVVIVAPISPDQSERSKISLDQSESRI